MTRKANGNRSRITVIRKKRRGAFTFLMAVMRAHQETDELSEFRASQGALREVREDGIECRLLTRGTV